MRRQQLMQLIGTLVVGAALVVLPTVALAQGITGTGHDMKGEVWNTSGEICIVCHTPHDADNAVAAAPLWNHEVTAVAVYQVYSSATLDSIPGDPAGVSKLCLSCHDGTVALDNFGGSTGGGDFISAANLVGPSDLRYEHPISVAYDSTADGGLRDETVALSGIAGSSGTINDDMLFGGNVECASCHDPHDAAGLTSFLVKANTASDLCLTCHDK
jgi:predicted CXXCH cytochrome family protein